MRPLVSEEEKNTLGATDGKDEMVLIPKCQAMQLGAMLAKEELVGKQLPNLKPK